MTKIFLENLSATQKKRNRDSNITHLLTRDKMLKYKFFNYLLKTIKGTTAAQVTEWSYYMNKDLELK